MLKLYDIGNEHLLFGKRRRSRVTAKLSKLKHKNDRQYYTIKFNIGNVC